MRKKYLILYFVLSASILFSENVKIIDLTETKENIKPGNIKYKSNNRNITIMNSGPVTYNFIYNYIDDPAYLKLNPKVALPCIGDITAKNTGIGLNPGWYGNGFLGIRINGKNVSGTLASVNAIEKTDCGGVEFSWALPEGNVKAVFIASKNSDRLFCEISSDFKEKIKSFSISFLAMPGHSGVKDKFDRWCSTAENNWQNATDGQTQKSLNIKKENWLIFYDGRSNKPLGTSGLLFDPNQLQAVQCRVGATIISVDLTVKPELSKVRFILWGFPEDYKSAEDAYDWLNENSSKNMEDLKKIKF